MGDLITEWLQSQIDNSSLLVGNCSCDLKPHITTLKLFSICNLPLVPSWLLAVVIGLSFSSLFLRLGPSVTGSLSYAITFAMYAVMITSGLVVHCLFLVECGGQQPSKAYSVFGRIDGSLTSSIAVSFTLNGLVDMKLFSDRSPVYILLSLLSYLAIFSAYFFELVPAMTLYMTSVIVGCGVYLLCQVTIMLESPGRLSLAALGYILLAGLFGGGSLWLLKTHYCWLCTEFGAWSLQGVWYYGSDLSMSCLGMYVWSTRNKAETKVKKSKSRSKNTKQ